ncbi:Peroxisome biosynthesis protein pex1 [Nowakowskiella sp. JEL0407]|nr:Peroxisome biosynthesis protein pex1 [Nowakowskiella sp. JEL0407]
MDGAEGLKGVYVLAATSRPDLIDPALLRPGRLDKSILCDIPSISDRIEILQAASRKLSLSGDAYAYLTNLAEQLENYSGADCQALLYNSHLHCVKDTLNDSLKLQQTNNEPLQQDFISIAIHGAENIQRSKENV